MNHSTYQRIQLHPQFQELVSKRSRFAWTLSALMFGLYLTFILLIAFQPQLLAIPVSSTTPITWGIVFGIGLILSAFVLTGIYVHRANGEFDRLTLKILEEVK